MTEKCLWCRYSIEAEVERDYDNSVEVVWRKCVRYAPRKICGVGTGFEDKRFPRVLPDEWCGEYEPAIP